MNLFSRFRLEYGRQFRTSSASRRLPRRPGLESLEDRTVPSISVPSGGTPGVATLTGTPGNDSFLIRIQGGTSGTNTQLQLSDNGGASFTSVALSNVTSIAINGMAGKDTLTIDNSNGLVASANGLTINFNPGPGTDTLNVTGNAGPGVAETYTLAGTLDAGAMTASNGQANLTVNFSRVEQIVDTLTANSLTFNTTNSNTVLGIHNGPMLNGVVTGEIDTFDHGALNLTPHHDMNGMLGDDADDNGMGGTTPMDAPGKGPNPGPGGPGNQGNGPGNNGGPGNQGNGPGPGGPGPGKGPVPVDVEGQLSLVFANKTSVTVNGGAGDDLFDVSIPAAPAGLTTLTLNGGGGTNTVLLKAVPMGVTLTTPNFQNIVQAADQAFITSLYDDDLGREPGTADFDFWMPILNGPGGRDAVVQGIEHSLEADYFKINLWYQQYLGHDADDAGLSFWANLMNQGESDEQVLAGILSSQEFLNLAMQGGTGASANEQFVNFLFAQVLNRPASSSDTTFWMGFLGNQGAPGRQAMVQVVLESLEFRSDEVQEFYTDLLHRPLDSAGANFWLNQPFSLDQIRDGIESSNEAFSS